MSDLQKRNAKAMQDTLERYTAAMEAQIERADKLSRAVSLLQSEVRQLKQEVTVLRATTARTWDGS